ncbi:MAG: RNA methyltransferase [Alphaproteobacteria bacterium]|nr:RNA methyltransferase [Alphaproteobacteria bacterium]
MRGYFGIGVEGISKEYNLGNLVRSAHAFGASFFFTIAPNVDFKAMRVSDTAGSLDHVPYHQYESVEGMTLPKDCSLVGIEFIEESVELPSFRHPVRAAYVLGPEMGSLSPELIERCDHVVKIPMKFCVNVGVAGALVMYDRMLSMGRFAERPVRAGGGSVALPQRAQAHRRRVRGKKER